MPAKKPGHPVVDAKVLKVCHILRSLPTKIPPKVFFKRFLKSDDARLAYLRRYWASDTGINSTMGLVADLRDEIHKTSDGRAAWEPFILEEAIKIASRQEPPRGNYPGGTFHSSSTVSNSFFTSEEKEVHDSLLTNKDMPFVYGLLMGLLGQATATEEEETVPVVIPREVADPILQPAQLPEEVAGDSYEDTSSPLDRYNERAKRVVTTVCSMLAFARNRRSNALQLHNSVQFFSCGISERVQEYMNYIGLCSSRSTAMAALKTLAKGNIKTLKDAVAIHKDMPMAASICIDNIDMEQRVHQISVGKRSHTFRGTWGYIHLPDKKLLATLDPQELTTEAYHAAINKVKAMDLDPLIFLPTPAEEKIEVQVWKSQIASVLLQYIATPSDKSDAVSTLPPVVEQISHEVPQLHMLKLIDASDNSAEGIGQVFQNIMQQTGLTVEEFFSQFQPMDGDLGTVQNFNCLKGQKAPSALPQHRMDNIFFQLGASHTIWNIASNILSHHFGNSSDSTNCGAWQHLEALGFPSEKAIQKKDFTLMVNQMERIYEALIYYCLR
ncbi:hypothetical protein Pst134EB_008878 [Puccinia striiformis f. sp. tritici]|nr:hypothetical protein Pst134EB_008878 [Puccinia striiformis f. sp. tritici]